MNQPQTAPEKYPYKLPRLVDYAGDMAKDWFFIYYIWNVETGKLVRKRVAVNGATAALRMSSARRDMKTITELLVAGATTGKLPKPAKPRIDLAAITMRQAAAYFLNYKNSTLKENGFNRLPAKYNPGKARVSQNMYDSYGAMVKHLYAWLESAGRSALKLEAFGLPDTRDFFGYLREDLGIQAKTYNNYKGYLSTLFNYFIEQEDLKIKNPAARIESLPVETSEMHMPFSNEQLLRIEETLIGKGDRQLLLFIKFLYYLFLRPGIELRLLRVRDIKAHTVFVPADRAKNNKGEHVVIPAALEEIIAEFGLRSYNKDYYVFSALGVPGPEPAGINYFYKRHRKLLDELELTDEQYTLYGYKHTGAINLYEATKDLLAVQRHCRHSSSSQTDAYLRKYGVIVDTKVVNMPRFGRQ